MSITMDTSQPMSYKAQCNRFWEPPTPMLMWTKTKLESSWRQLIAIEMAKSIENSYSSLCSTWPPLLKPKRKTKKIDSILFLISNNCNKIAISNKESEPVYEEVEQKYRKSCNVLFFVFDQYVHKGYGAYMKIELLKVDQSKATPEIAILIGSK